MSRAAFTLAWLAGGLTIAALAYGAGRLLPAAWRVPTAVSVLVAPAATAVGALPLAPLTSDASNPGVGDVRGVVRGADGRPLTGATVSLYRVVTAWPEWRREQLTQTLVGADGAFRFRAPVAHGLLVGVEHPQHAEQLCDAVVDAPPLELRLAPGFALAGVVRTEAGAPVANARVAVESVVGDNRRVRVEVTTTAGEFVFRNLEAGPARVVARHPSWQPTALPVVVVGQQEQVEVRVARPALAPLRGVVVDVAARAPVEGAEVELFPTNAQPGLVDPLATRTGADGRFTIAGLPRSVMRLVVRHPKLGAVVRTLPVGVAEATVEVELPRRSAVLGGLDARGGLPTGAILQLRDLAGHVAFAPVAADGTFRFPGEWSPGFAELRLVGVDAMFVHNSAAATEARIDEEPATEMGFAVAPPFGVRGRVIDEDGAPIAGATVVRKALRADAARIGDAAAQFDVSGLSRSVAQWFAVDRDEPIAVTGPDGVFACAGARRDRIGLRLSAPDRAVVDFDAAVTAPLARVQVETIVLPKATRLRGLVARGGTPFAGALVVAYRGDDAVATAVTDAQGAWAIDAVPAGAYRVRARNPAQAAAGPFVAVEAVVGGGPQVVLQLAPPRLVRGHVVARDGTPLAGVAVSLRRSVGVSVVTSDDGAFALEAPEREGEIQVVRPNRAGVTFARIPADGALLRVALDAPPTCGVTAVIAGLPGRRRLPAALLRIVPADEDDDVDAIRGAWFDLDDGELQWSGCPAGRVRIEVWSEGFAPVVIERELAAGKPHDLGEILLERGARLRGVVVGPDGQPVPDAQVLLGDEADFEAFEPATRSGADGGFTLTGVSGRSSRLVVRAAGFAPRAVDLALPGDVLSARPMQVALQAGAAIEAVVERGAARTAGFVVVRRARRFVANVEIDEANVAVIANLPPGNYELSLLGDDRPAKVVTLAPGVLRANVQLP
ncbi:MAG: carboxypeptidase regulatory-like domain-containing protein [Planctomycetes bacterium]|nr:carboxypeptidase regulatory-like domain-containing protein [Planctomycetota bacterium]